MVKHVEVGYKMEAPEGCPPEIYEMMRQAWELNPAKRPTFAELKVKLQQLNNATAWEMDNNNISSSSKNNWCEETLKD